MVAGGGRYRGHLDAGSIKDPGAKNLTGLVTLAVVGQCQVGLRSGYSSFSNTHGVSAMTICNCLSTYVL